jgi:hypothetical protein
MWLCPITYAKGTLAFLKTNKEGLNKHRWWITSTWWKYPSYCFLWMTMSFSPRWPRLCRCPTAPPFIRTLLFSTYASPFLSSSLPSFFIIASLLWTICNLCKQHKLAPTSYKPQKTLCKLTKPIFPCSLLLAIVGHFHSCLLFHPSTLITNNHLVGKNKIKS